MKVDVLIDKLTPCLEEVATGKILQTVFSIATDKELSNLKGWNFDWTVSNLSRTNIYKLTLKDDNEIQGLISAEVVKGAVYIHIVESAPHNLGENKKYKGVGGHLFAIAIKLSKSQGFGGYVYFDAKNQTLMQHYTQELNARHLRSRIHDYRMEIDVPEATEIINKYTLEGDLNVNED